MVELKSNYGKKEDIPETVNYADQFTERNGEWELTGISGTKTQADVDRSQTSLTKERADHKATKDKLGVWGDLDHSDVVAKLDRLPELEAASKGKLDDAAIDEIVNRRVEGTLKSKISPLERELTKLKKENGDLLEANTGFKVSNVKRTIHDSMRKAMRTAKVIGEAEEDVLMRDGLFEITEDGNVVTRDGVGITPGLDPASWLTEVQETKSHWWPMSQGGGARGSGGGKGFAGKNPWSHDGWNMTDQGAYFTEHGAERAKKMAEAAGTSIGGPKPAKKTG